MFSHCAASRVTSRSSSASAAPSAAVRTITPAFSGVTFLRMCLSRFRSVSGSLRLIPVIDAPGTYTRYRPGRLTWLVSRAPLWPTGSLVTCTITDWPAFSADSMRFGWPSRPLASKLTSPAYSTALRPLPMSTNAASIDGSTFCTLPRYTLPT